MDETDQSSRRVFLTQSIAALGALYIPWDLLKSRNMGNINILEKGILFSKEDVPGIRKNTEHPFFKEYWQSLVNADLKADTKFIKEEVNYRRKFRDLIRASRIVRRSSFVSLLENRKDHEDLAKLAIEKILSFEEWDYFLEGGTEKLAFQCAPETLFNLIFACDWMRDKLSQAEKDDIFKAIAEKGAKPCYSSLYGMRYPEKVIGWTIDPREEIKTNVDCSRWPIIINRTNLKMIPIAGLIYSALVLEGKHTDSKKWLEMGLWSIKDFTVMWEKDGCYSEGYSYSGYSTKHMILASDILNRTMGKKYSNIINYQGYSKFLLRMTAPFKDNQGGCINFGDNAFSIDAGFIYWIAKEFKDSIAQYTAEKIPNVQSVQDILNIIWYDDSVKSIEPTQDLMDVKFINEWVISRSGFGENDIVVGFRSGGPANHEHADRNSIILNGYGERFFHDPLGAAYNNFDKHWLLRQTESHTSVLVDGKGHQYHDGREGTNSSKAVAKITQYKPGKKITVVSSDATQAYNLVNNDVKKIQRTIVFVKPDILIIIDEMKKIKGLSKFQARFQAFNKDNKATLKADMNSFQIQRPNAKLFAKMDSTSKLNISTGELDVPKDLGVFPYIEVAAEPSKECIIITATVMIPEEQKAQPEIDISSKENEYKIKIKSVGKETSLLIKINKDYPEVKLI